MIRVMTRLDPTNEKTKAMTMTKTGARKKTITCVHTKTMTVKMAITMPKTTKTIV